MFITALLSILISLIYCLNHFNYDERVTLTPEPEYIADDSLFGYHVLYIPADNAFYVGAPNTLNNNLWGRAEVGAVYKCNKYGNVSCTRSLLPRSVDSFSNQYPIRPLFGFSFLESDKNSLLICAPNIVYADSSRTYCVKIDRTTGTEVTDGGFPTVRIDESTYIMDTYGQHVEHCDPITVSNPKYLISQRNFIYNTIDDPTSEFTYFLVLTSYDTFKQIGLSNIPSFEFIVIPNDNQNYLIMPYSYTNNLVGSFDVLNSDFFNRQKVNLSVGTAGQQFGYASTYGKFSISSCTDIILTAPFFTVNMDEGAVYLFKCIDSSHMFDENPIALHGETAPFARFGTSVANLKDLNHDGFEDIVVLATYWYMSKPQLFIYYSGENGFTDAFAQKISLDEAEGTDYTKVFAQLLYAGFDANGDGVNDLVVTYPVENRVIYMTGILFTELEIKTTSSMLLDEAIYLSTQVSSKTVNQSYYAISLRVCMSIKYLTDIILSQNIQMGYSFDILKRPGSYFYVNNTIETEINGSIGVKTVVNEFCTNNTLLYQNTFISGQESIEISVYVMARGTESICHGQCIQPDPYFQNINIFPDILECNETDCLPQFELYVNMSQQPFEIGTINKRTIWLTLYNSGVVKSYYPTAVIITTGNILVTNASVDGISNTMTIYDSENETTQELSRYYTYPHDLMPGDEITFTLDIEVIPYIADISITFQFKGLDAMFTYSETDPTVVEIPTIETFGFLNGTSVPEKINALKVNDTLATISEDLKYNVKVTNKLTAASLDDAYIVVELPLSVLDSDIFTIKSVIASQTLTNTSCQPELHIDCGSNVIVYHAPSLSPVSTTTVEITLKPTSSASVFIENDIVEIEMIATLLFTSGDHQENETIIVKTSVQTQAETDDTTLIIAISVSVIIAILLLALCCWLAYKYKAMDKLKAAASK